MDKKEIIKLSSQIRENIEILTKTKDENVNKQALLILQQARNLNKLVLISVKL
jgi:fructose-1,6-bisphosphatase/sedoheptulose 1,7-bisphosphatase-like protein